MADLKEHIFCVMFSFALDKAASETYEMLSTAFGEIAIGRTQSTGRVLFSRCGETSIEDYGRSGRPSTDHGSGKVVEVCRIINEHRRSLFGYHRLVRPLVLNVLANCNGRSEHGANHREVYDSVTDRRTHARAIFGRQEQGRVPVVHFLYFAPWGSFLLPRMKS